MGVINMYRATNTRTKEKLEGSALELGNILGVSDTCIRVSCNNGVLVGRAWNIDLIGTNRNHRNDMPMDLAREWEKVTAPFRELSRKKKEREAKNEAKKKDRYEE